MRISARYRIWWLMQLCHLQRFAAALVLTTAATTCGYENSPTNPVLPEDLLSCPSLDKKTVSLFAFWPLLVVDVLGLKKWHQLLS